ncbi:MFS transporter [Kribbella sp. NBC_01505]|uniref:MFS transporter n=1 Tax=Kribbella sp. NBC_01505 TaxID=2903580 RepID=UPI00386388C5
MTAAFRAFWLADTTNQLGTAIRTTSLPLVGVTVLALSPWQMGVLTAAATTAFLLLGLPAGALVDRWPRRRLMLIANLTRTLLLATIPITGWLGLLSFGQLVGTALLIGAMTVLYDVAGPAVVQSVVPPQRLTESNGRLQTTQAGARLAGPPLAGVVTQWTDAASTTGLSAVGYLLSALLLRRVPEAPRPDRSDQHSSLRADVLAGLRYTFGHSAIRAIAACGAAYNLFLNLGFAVQVLFLADQLRLPAASIGLLLSASAAGQVLGAATAAAWGRQFGEVRALIVVLCLAQPFALLLPLGWPAFATGTFVTGYGVAVYNVLQLSYRQHVCPPELFGRMAASTRVLTWGAIPLGALAGGGLGEWIGVRATLWVAAIGGLLAPACLLASPLRRIRTLTDPPASVRPGGGRWPSG